MNPRSVKPTLAQPAIQPSTATRAVASLKEEAEGVSTGATGFRPVFRPPMAVIEILDDGAESGEKIRIRTESTVIGRSGADIVIPHDSQISGKHVTVLRKQVDGEWQWLLQDMGSTNGTFLRVARCPLAGNTTVLLGVHRYRFRPAAVIAAPSAEESQATKGWQIPSADDLKQLTASLVRIFPDGSERDFPIPAENVTIGSDASRCQLCIDDDPMVNGVHAQLHVSAEKQTLEDLKSVNGIWASVTTRRLAKSSTFQIGEQRIRFRIL